MRIPLPSRQIDSHATQLLDTDWLLASTAPDACATSIDAREKNLQWQAAVVPGTVAQSLNNDVNIPGVHDKNDWWYRTQFSADTLSKITPSQRRLRFEGLATCAEIWLNDKQILTSNNMFCTYVVDITDLLQTDNQLYICFRALSPRLDLKKPRPRWKTALTSHQNLRWFRTTLLGRMPGWSPPIDPVGPWRPITLETVSTLDVAELDLQARAEGSTGIISLNARLCELSAPISRAEIIIDSQRFNIDVAGDSKNCQLTGSIRIPNVPLWWPNTHGNPTLLPCHIELFIGAQAINIDCGKIGFKSVNVDRSDGKVQIQINGVPVFCRGACWTINDFISLSGSDASLRRSLELARDANMNMLRIGGTMVYESDYFYQLCDELGIMVWQDFMFANMDYPIADKDFHANVQQEITQQLNRLQKHACLTAYCGGSEIEQQAAMMGLPSSEWSNSFFSETLPTHCQQLHSGIPYFRGSPSEGALPFHVSTGIAHYYGVGAYRRPLTDAKYAGVKFTTECLGFSNVPEAETMLLLNNVTMPVPHHPRWKARVPRDNGTPWDFEDIRDFYLRELFDVDPVKLRSEDLERYYAVSRVTSGEVMRRTYAEWRRNDNPCNGAIVWFYKDLWPGAGWGIIDSENNPKAAYHKLRKAWAPQALSITDEGQDGLLLHLINETNSPYDAQLHIDFLQQGTVKVLSQQKSIHVSARANLTLQLDEIIGHFTDSNYAYRFGPAKHDTVIARLIENVSGRLIAEDFYFVAGMALPTQSGTSIATKLTQHPDGTGTLELTSSALIQNVALTAAGFIIDTNHFNVGPDQRYTINFSPLSTKPKALKVYLEALNLRETLTLRPDINPN